MSKELDIPVWNWESKIIPLVKLGEMKKKLVAVMKLVNEKFVLPNDRYLMWEAKINRDGNEYWLFVSIALRKAGLSGGLLKTLKDKIGVVDQKLYFFCQVDFEVLGVPASVDELAAFVIESLDKPFAEEERALCKQIHNPAW